MTTSRPKKRAALMAYPGTLAVLVLAMAFPIGLMVLNPTLMFERGWEQFVGTGIYCWAVVMLGRELLRMGRDEQAFLDASSFLESPATIAEDDARLLPSRLRQLSKQGGSGQVTMPDLMELNREASGLDQEQVAGRFLLTKYILYLLPVIGFIGTVEGISKALMNISKVLPMVKDLDGFMSNLTSVTSALQIAFDSTLLALFLSAALMFAQTLVFRRSEDLLARVDRWVVENLLSAASMQPAADPYKDFAATLVEMRTALASMADRLGEGLGSQVDRFGSAIDRLSPAVIGLQRGADAIGLLGDDLRAAGQAGESIRRGVASLGRMEAAIAESAGSSDAKLDEIRLGIDRTCSAIENLSGQWSAAFERSSRTTQEQLARTLHSLKDALDMLQVSMEQGNALYRTIVKKMVTSSYGVITPPTSDEMAA